MKMPSGFNHLKDELQSYAIVGWPDQALDQLRQMSEALQSIVEQVKHRPPAKIVDLKIMSTAAGSLEKFQKWSE